MWDGGQLSGPAGIPPSRGRFLSLSLSLSLFDTWNVAKGSGQHFVGKNVTKTNKLIIFLGKYVTVNVFLSPGRLSFFLC